jgi:hypothetical protein
MPSSGTGPLGGIELGIAPRLNPLNPGFQALLPADSVRRFISNSCMEFGSFGPAQLSRTFSGGPMSCFSKPLFFLSLFLMSPIALAKGDAGTRLTRNKIEISGKVLFETGSAQLKSGSQALLQQVATILKENPDLPVIQIGGHTDNVGEADANKKLSARRAKAVMEHLVSLGVPKDRLQAKGFGESRPVAMGKSSKAHASNRRVDFLVVRPLTFSGNVGMALTGVSGSDDLKGTAGLIVGSTAHYAVTDVVSTNIGLAYARRGFVAGSDDGAESAKFSAGYIDVPITADYTFLLPYWFGFHPRVGGGLKFSFLTGATYNGEPIEVNSMQTGLVLTSGGTYDLSFGTFSATWHYTIAMSGISEEVEGVKLNSNDLMLGLVF